jgi:hypothetical protein
MIRVFSGKGTSLEGRITKIDIPTFCIHLDTEMFGIRNLTPKERSSLRVGDYISLKFPNVNAYQAEGVEVLQRAKTRGDIMKVKTIEERLKEVKEIEPFFGQELVDSLSTAERTTLRELMNANVETATRLYGIKATFDDTKKDITDIAEEILEISAILTAVVDSNTSQIIKSHIK